MSIIFQTLGVPNDLVATLLKGTWQVFAGFAVFMSIYSSVAIAVFCEPKEEIAKEETA